VFSLLLIFYFVGVLLTTRFVQNKILTFPNDDDIPITVALGLVWPVYLVVLAFIKTFEWVVDFFLSL
jgi:hypothetical protein